MVVAEKQWYWKLDRREVIEKSEQTTDNLMTNVEQRFSTQTTPRPVYRVAARRLRNADVDEMFEAKAIFFYRSNNKTIILSSNWFRCKQQTETAIKFYLMLQIVIISLTKLQPIWFLITDF